jgi:hypothetical protein
MNHSVLIVTPFFAPQSHAAVFRAYKLAKYLPRYGWKPYVLTVDRNYLYNEDPTLLANLPSEVEIFTARYIEPSIRGLRMALGGRNRTFSALKAENGFERVSEAKPGRIARAANQCYDYLSGRWLRTPDAYWTWRRPALAMARRLIRQHDIPLVFTSADPYTSHLIGLDLQRDGCRWVADLRDPHAYNARTASPYYPVYARQLAAERAAVHRADAVTVAAEAIAMIVTDMHGLKSSERLYFIPTGLDEELIPQQAPILRPYPYLVFSGEYLDAYGTDFLQIFSDAVRSPALQKLGYKLLIVGRRDVNRRLLPTLRDLDLTDRVELVDHMPQRDLYQLLLGASAGVILSTRLFQWWCLYAKMVDYIALRKPVVALVPDPSEARTRLTKARLGVFLDGDREAATEKLVGFLSGQVKVPEPDAEECRRYLASSQVSEFVSVFESVVREQLPTT